MNPTEGPRCPRCGAAADTDWAAIVSFGGDRRMVPVRAACPTPGCVDEHGAAAVAPPPTPLELLARADRMWLDAQHALAGTPTPARPTHPRDWWDRFGDFWDTYRVHLAVLTATLYTILLILGSQGRGPFA